MSYLLHLQFCRYLAGGVTFQFFFFQAEDGIRDLTVTGVQTCALPILVMVAGGSLLLGRLPFDGALFLIVAGVYATGRMALESLREREHAAQRFDIGRTVSALTVACTAALLIVQWPR